MLRKIISFTLAVLLATVNIPIASAREYPELNTDSRAALLMEYESGEILFASNEHERMPMASVTDLAMPIRAERESPTDISTQ